MRDKKGKGRKMLAVILSTVLAVSMAFSGTAAFAGSGDSASSDSNKISSAAFSKAGELSGGTTLNDAIGGNSGGSDEKDPLEGTVLVMMGDDSLKTEKKVKKALSAGEEPVKDIDVEEVWSFSDEKSGLKLNSEGGKHADDGAVIALVSSDSMSAGGLARKLNKRGDVQLAEKNVRVHAASISNDPYSDYQWSMQPNDNAPHIEYEWNDKGVTGTDKIVAVVDTGVDYTHPDLKDNMWVNTHKQIKGKHGYDFINGDSDPMDDNGHGTHCAGIIGAVGNNSEGICGVNQKVRIMALKILDNEGSSWLSHEIAAYNYINMAIDLGEPVVAINNSWNGEESSEIFKKLVDVVGSKGAASVCSAGNESSNNDEFPVFPCNIDSPYLIDVAATDRSGNLAFYSNYGESVDVAAPGSEMLSTVSYVNYNPSLYGSKQSSISAEFNSYTDDSNTFGVPDKIYLNGEECEKSGNTFKGRDGQEITLEKVNEGFADSDKRSLKITYKGIKTDDLVCFAMPYEVQENAKIRPSVSMMCRKYGTNAPKDSTASNIFFATEISADKKLDLDALGDEEINGFYVNDKDHEWDHLKMTGSTKTEAGEKRQFVVGLYSTVNGSYTVQLDDIGISRQDIDEDSFGKYDFKSGTSMASPFVAGVVALKAAEREKSLKEGEKLDIADILNEISAMAKEEPKLDVLPEGAFDFRLIPTVLPPRVGKLTVDTKSDTIKISGSGLYVSQPGFKVELGEDDDHMREAEIIPSDGKEDGSEILIKNDKWINNVENVRVTGAGGKVSRKKGLYLVDGKKEYKHKENMSFDLSSEASCTDGKNLYGVWSQNREVRVQDIQNKESESRTLAEVKVSDIFKINKDENVRYGMLFGKDLVYSNGLLYNVVEYGAAEEIESADDDDIWIENKKKEPGSGKKKAADEADDDDGVDYFESAYSIYSGEYKLISIGTTSSQNNKVKNLGKLPKDLENLDDYTMAAYNGRIYFIGGSAGYGDDKQYSDKVFVYDPAKKKWSDGAALPEGRAGGKALQCGSKLIYTLGTSQELNGEPINEDDFSVKLPDNLVFNGKTWRACSVENDLVKMYNIDVLSVGLTKKGLIYSGAPVNDYGDSFIYDVSQNKYVDTGYNYLTDPLEYGPTSVVIGKTLYGVSYGEIYTMPVESGLLSVTVKKKGKGKVKGAGSYMPGNDVKITVKAAKKYYIKSLKVAGKTIKLSKKAAKKVYTISKVTKDQKVQVVFAKK